MACQDEGSILQAHKRRQLRQRGREERTQTKPGAVLFLGECIIVPSWFHPAFTPRFRFMKLNTLLVNPGKRGFRGNLPRPRRLDARGQFARMK